MDGRLCYLYTSDAAALKGDNSATPPALKNDFRVNASLAKTKRLSAVIQLPNVSNMHQIVEREWQYFDRTEKSGQHGPELHMALTKSLLQRGPEGGPTAAAQGYWIRQHDRTTIIDFHPHAGDALESTLSLQEDSSFPGQAKHLVVDFT